MAVILEVYVQAGCLGCEHAQRLAREVKRRLPQAEARIIDLALSEGQVNPAVLAVPTYMVNSRVRYLGNPHLQDLLAELQGLFE